MDMGPTFCFKFLFIYGGLVSVSRNAKMEFNFNIHVLKSGVNNGIFHAFILGKICACERSFVANDGNCVFYIPYGCRV